MLSITANNVSGLDDYTREKFEKLLEVYEKHYNKNVQKEKYYEGAIPLSDVNLGIALPKTFSGLEIGCSWGAKTVDVLAARSMFDGFVGMSGQDVLRLTEIVESNQLIDQYMRACRDELLYGCTFCTLSADDQSGAKIRFHSPQTAAGLWDGERGMIDCGFAVIDSEPANDNELSWEPSLINIYTDRSVWVLHKVDDEVWDAEEYPHKMGRPLMQPLTWNATSRKPFGRSRIKEPIRRLIDGYVRTLANATIGLEFSTSPQKYLLGITDDQYDAVVNAKFQQYVGNILAATNNPETGEKPSFGQLVQGNISPHVEMLRVLATQFSAATGLSVTDTGVVNAANPTSSDAILAQTQTLVAMAEQLNTGNGDALKQIALMALAIDQNVALDELSPEDQAIMAHFKNPAMPSIAATADAAIKIAQAREGFSSTDTFLQMIGFDAADIRRIKAEEQRSRGAAVLASLVQGG